MFTTRPELTGEFGMVASTHWLATGAGMSVLERGGNAFDAAAAAGFVLQVVEPHLNGPGGEVPILLWSEDDQRVHVVAGQGVAPAAATIERFAGLGLSAVPGTGLLAATVPGAFGGWMEMLSRWGTWRLPDVLDYAIGIATRGFPVLPAIARTIGTVEAMFRSGWPTSAAVWLPDGRPPAAGTRLRRPDLAATYTRIVAEARARSGSRDGQLAAARDIWYQGFVAEEIADFCAGTAWPDTSGRAHAGLLTGADLAGWRPGIESPVTYDYHGYTVCKTGPWGQGPVFAQQLALLSGFDLAGAGHLSVDWVHTITECAKLAFADREAWYGDPTFTDVPLDALLSPGYNASRRVLVSDTASLLLRPGRPDGRVPVLADAIIAAGGAAATAGRSGPSRLARVDRAPGSTGALGEPTVGDFAAVVDRDAASGEPVTRADGSASGDTCHVDVVDRWGNMVSATPSGGWLQSSPAIPALGFCLGTRAQMFWLQPGLPNSLRPGARPRTTLSPSLALRDGRPYLAFGTPGGDQQDQWSLNFLLALIHAGGNLQAAIDAPMFHSAHVPSSFYPHESRPGLLLVEDRLDPAVRAGLRRRGHRVELAGEWSLGRLSAVARDGADGRTFRAAANPRGAQGYAAGR